MAYSIHCYLNTISVKCARKLYTVLYAFLDGEQDWFRVGGWGCWGDFESERLPILVSQVGCYLYFYWGWLLAWEYCWLLFWFGCFQGYFADNLLVAVQYDCLAFGDCFLQAIDFIRYEHPINFTNLADTFLLILPHFHQFHSHSFAFTIPSIA